MNTSITTSYSNQPTLYAGSGALTVTHQVNNNNASEISNDVSYATNDNLERVKKSQFIMEKYPDRVPLIIQPSKNDRDSYPIDKSKYITPRDLTLLQLQHIIRRRIRFPVEGVIYVHQ